MKRFLLCLVVFSSLSGIAHAVPSYQEVRTSYIKSDSLLVDRHGEILHEMRTDKYRRKLDWTPLTEVSPALKEAVVQTEDKRFFSHSGVDYGSIGAAVIKGMSQEGLRGASTITMQLASLLNKETDPRGGRKSLWQKGRQILDAWEVEKGWSKAEILEAYLNLVTFRGELQGIAAASRGLFGKDPHGLDRPESLILASLIRSPNASSTEVLRRTSLLNRSMDWRIEERDIEGKVSQVFLGLPHLQPRKTLAPHLANLLLKDKPKGSTVSCTLDREIQSFSLDRLSYHLSSLKSQRVGEGAILVVENATGNVLAYGSWSNEPLNHRFVDGVQAKRQAGSTLKPFLYAHAFDRRILTPASLLDDTPLDIAVVNGIYQPRDYDSEFKGRVTARVALASSLNVPAVRTLSLVGTESLLNVLRRMEIKGLNEAGDFYGPSLALGTADVSLWELTNAYRTLANDGEWRVLYLTQDARAPLNPKRIFSKEAAFLVSDILSDREARSSTFGLENPLATRFWTAVKTGTSKDMRDNWCVGYSRKYTVGVWVGNFSGEPMWNVSGITGAAPIWVEVMEFLHRKETSPREKPPAGLVRSKVQFAQTPDYSTEEWFIRGTEPTMKEQKTGQFNDRILYPPSGTIIALDPDIPSELQKIFFLSQSNGEKVRWELNGKVLEGSGKTQAWSPNAGRFHLALLDKKGKVIDSVQFEVRGPTEE